MQLPCQHTVSTYYIFQLQNEIILADTEANDDQSNEVCPSPFTSSELKKLAVHINVAFQFRNKYSQITQIIFFFFFWWAGSESPDCSHI